MEEKIEKISFFKKVWYSITKFEQYPNMAMEGLKRAIKYLALLTAILSVFMMLCTAYEMRLTVLNVADYIQENIPEFTYSNGNISLDIQEPIVIEKLETTGVDKITINTLIENDNEKEQFKKDNSVEGINAFFFKDYAVLKIQSEGYENIEQKYAYTDLIVNFADTSAENFAKSDFVQFLKNGKMTKFYSTYAVSIYGYYFVENFMVALIYSLEIALLGWITTIVLRVRMRFKALYNMSAYAITLSTILMTIYVMVNYFTGFTIKEFQIAYIAIAYIYLVAAIFILKDDVIKKMQEVEILKQEQMKVREEIKQEEKKEDKEEKQDKEEKNGDNENDEPQGSEA